MIPRITLCCRGKEYSRNLFSPLWKGDYENLLTLLCKQYSRNFLTLHCHGQFRESPCPTLQAKLRESPFPTLQWHFCESCCPTGVRVFLGITLPWVILGIALLRWFRESACPTFPWVIPRITFPCLSRVILGMSLPRLSRRNSGNFLALCISGNRLSPPCKGNSRNHLVSANF